MLMSILENFYRFTEAYPDPIFGRGFSHHYSTGFYSGALKYREQYGMSPRQIILGNHGLCTFGNGKEEALATTQIAVKAARVRLGALAAGGINFIPNSAAQTIAFRPDEVARRKLLTGNNK